MFTELGKISEETRMFIFHPGLNDGIQDWWHAVRY